MARTFELKTPLGPDVLRFHRMQASEELGRLSEFQIDALSDKADINVDDILGKNVTVKVELADGSLRHFNGYVTRFAQAGMRGRYHTYQASVRPWLWFLTRRANCRIFQKKTVPDILKKIFNDYPGLVDIKFDVTSNYRTWDYCVQYRESDFNFVSRLMEQEGIYYYFKYQEGRNTLVLADSYSAHSPRPGCEQLPYIPEERTIRPEQECISTWSFEREIQPGRYVINDYDAEKPSLDLQVKTNFKRDHVNGDFEFYDYPGEYLKKDEGEQYVRTRIEELHTQFELAKGRTNSRGLSVGYLVKLTGQPRADQNREYLIVSAQHTLKYGEYESMEESGAFYDSSFTMLNSRQQYRAARSTRKPFVQGPQTAVVVGPSGNEIYTDKYGRVKVQFHWDREGEKNENSSSWIRVSHPWAGKNWGMVAIPRIGQEVIVDFLEGNPDQPIITGRVYNAENMPPADLPSSGMVSGLKSNSTPGGGGYNEMTMNDTKGKEKITIHSQYDMGTTVEHDQTTTVNNNRTDKINIDDSETVGSNQTSSIGNDQNITIGANRTESVGGLETIMITGHRTETVNGGETVTVSGGRSHTINGVQTSTISLAEVHTVGAGRMHNVGAAEAITVGGAQMVNVGAAQMVSVGGVQQVNVGGLQSHLVGGPHKLKAAAINQTSRGPFKIKAAATTIAEAPTIVLKAGGSKIIMDSSGITIKGAKITIKAQ